MAGAYFYVDTDGSGATSPHQTWATAAQDLATVLGNGTIAAGDIIFFQGSAADDYSAQQNLAGPGTPVQPVLVIGVKDGTTNTGTSVVTSDLATTYPKISTSGGAADFSFDGNLVFMHMEVADGDRPAFTTDTSFVKSKFSIVDRTNTINSPTIEFIDCEIDTSVGSSVTAWSVGAATSKHIFRKCLMTTGGLQTAGYIRSVSQGMFLFEACDFTDFGANEIMAGDGGGFCEVRLVNCKMPNAAYTLYAVAPTTEERGQFVELIGCQFAGSSSNKNIPAYEYQDCHGTIDIEASTVRTNGADDGSTGGFSYAMLCAANGVVESTPHCLKSPWLRKWTDGTASETFTVHIANTDADLFEDEVWLELMTPAADDAADHDMSFEPGDERKLASSTAVTDDTGSTWGNSPTYMQKLSITVTPGYAGEVRARVCFAKNDASPVALYVDPRIIVT